MRFYVCCGTFGAVERHACARAHHALEVVRTFGRYGTDPLFRGRREVKRLTGDYKVPTLVLDDGTVIDGSSNILAWAEANPSPIAEQRRARPR